MDFSCDYWLGIFPHVFYSKKGDTALLYNTRQGVAIQTENPDFIALIDEMHSNNNLGVIRIKDSVLKKDNIRQLISESIDKKICFCIPISETNSRKPVQMMPVLNLQRDVEKLTAENDRSVGEDIIRYLLNLTIHINTSCLQTCTHCSDYQRQFLFCQSNAENEQLSLEHIEHIFDQIEYAPLHKLNITGGDIFRYPGLKEMITLFEKYSLHPRFGIHYLNCSNQGYDLLDAYEKDVFVTFPLNEDYHRIISTLLGKGKVKIHFVISSELDYQKAEEIIEKYAIIDYQVLPFFDGNNKAFFDENVFMSEDDILATPIKQRIIFANQKMNTNFFGSLIVLPSGFVHATHNTPAIGNIGQQSILELLNTEMIRNTAWRRTRDARPCIECVYQYLCPSPSNYEYVFGKMNLCSVKND